MSEDAGLITMEDDSGAVALPPEFSATDSPADEPEVETQPEAAAEVVEPPAQPETEPEEPPAVRGLKAELARTREESKRWREQAEAIATVREAMARHPQAQEIIHALRTGQPLTLAQQKAVEAATQPAARSAAETQGLTALAESLSLYTVDGKPDVEAAERVAAFNRQESERIARKVAAEAFKPFRDREINTAAQQMRREAVEAGAKFGMTEEFVTPIIDNLIGSSPELASDPHTMSTALLVAKGLYAIQQEQAAASQSKPAAQPAAQPNVSLPQFSEHGGGRAAPVMSTLEKTIARQVGAKPEDWLGAVSKLTGLKEGQKHIVMEGDD